jgi:hypothetical protein
MQLTLEQAFTADLAMLISEYITKGLSSKLIEAALVSEIENLDEWEEYGPDEQRAWYDTSSELC